MGRQFAIIGGGIFAIACVCGAIIFYVLGAERAKDALDGARDYIEGTQNADEATEDVRRVGSCQWVCDTFGGPCNCAAGSDAPAD